jgi:hypothetical protein
VQTMLTVLTQKPPFISGNRDEIEVAGSGYQNLPNTGDDIAILPVI